MEFEQLKWEKVILYLYTEYERYSTLTYDEFRTDIMDNTEIDSEKDADEVLDFVKSVGLVEYDEEVTHHPLTTKGFDVGRELYQNKKAERTRKFNQVSQVVIATMTFFLGLSALTQVATIYDISNMMLSALLSTTVMALVIASLIIYIR